jgi:FKBP-type peptidyl-prolyl cis-trans isomerase
MKKTIILTILAAVLCCGCAHSVKSGASDAAKRYIEAWVQVQKQMHPEYAWKKTDLGSWILEDVPGKGNVVGTFEDSLYLRVNYTVYDLEGNITATTSEIVSKQLGEYDETYYYGPLVWYANGIYAGLEEMFKDMSDGSRRRMLIPSWLMTYDRYETEQEYMDNADEKTASIYDVELVEHFPYIQQWSADSVGRYLAANYPKKFSTNPYAATADSSGAFGFWYIQEKAPADTVTLKDTTVYINYIGRLLNGKVFDTTIRDTAIFYGLSRDKTYEPVSITFGSTWSDVTMGSEGSSVIQGFARTLCKMKSYEKGTGIFISSLGYGYKGSGSTIPGYSPLRFDIEIVDNPN